MKEIYKNYELTNSPNDQGYYEATSLIDCDAVMIFDKTLEGLKTEIDELN